MTDPAPAITIDTHLPADWADEAMREDVTRAFTRFPRVLPPKWLYDDRGSELFSAITRLAEYYPTEAERAILVEHASDIAAVTHATTVIELGSGTSDKTRMLLDAFHARGQLARFVPVDVSETTLLSAAAMLAERYDGTEVHAVVGDFTRHLRHLPAEGRRLLAFLGGTLGNLYVEERHAFLGAMADTLDEGEWVLLGVDLVKDVNRILDAYDDGAGLTDAFVKNMITVLNRELDADFDAAGLDYVPSWDAREERVDLRLRASTPQQARIGDLGLDVQLGEGEEIRVEISAKFRPDRLADELADAGFEVTNTWTDPNDDFALVLARRA